MKRGDQLGDFLASRRAKLRPEDVGLPPAGRRRVPGLRRTEVAQLAGVSVDYYIRLEQGRAAHPSCEVLNAVSRALQLDPSEHDHLLALAHNKPRRRPAQQRKVRPQIQHLIDAMDPMPAIALNNRMDVVAWNRMAAAVIVDFGRLPAADRNMARMVFLDPAARDHYQEWQKVAEETVAYLRYSAGQQPDDTGMAALVGELSMKSEVFGRLWARHDVRDKAHGSKRLRHPIVGEMTLFYETLELPGDPGLILCTYNAEPGSDSEISLRLLDSLTAREPRDGASLPGEAESPARRTTTTGT
ncbi:helix-turn-helix transcriptional regulator [Streptoalloteichus hindustanus]|uniref:Helix-turn-helix domain-containing protein n=1 Tax=Streptoalloteichus hindustanus TaxID=2017 RepID=A0A1M5A831_STRHI|nr:helix-turn-helix transcriptional regulator [Streptoalloteichus hindustanus]SHF26450.1 Helix-turn-helix domain-containing protein [Streptoalloteichus hindustanus]